MNLDFLNNISDTSRHNLFLVLCQADPLNDVIARLEIARVNVVNIGKALSGKLKEMKSTRFLNIESQEFLYGTIGKQSKEIVKDNPPVVAIYNLGILFEPMLSLNAETILKDLSKHTALIILWEHQFSPPAILHWGMQQDQYNINLSDINLTKVNLQHEI